MLPVAGGAPSDCPAVVAAEQQEAAIAIPVPSIKVTRNLADMPASLVHSISDNDKEGAQRCTGHTGRQSIGCVISRAAPLPDLFRPVGPARVPIDGKTLNTG
jgi:hypothetical protein